MKILHTGDWHIGKLVHGIHMTEDQKYILKQFVTWVKENSPDLIIIAGDLYDRSVPPTEAVELLDDILSDLVLGEKIPVIAITGNHDSSERVGFVGGILEKQGLYIYNDLSRITEPTVISDVYGEVHFYALPFMEPAKVKVYYQDDTITDYETAYKAMIKEINTVKKDDVRNVCITHGYIIGGETVEAADSVRPLSIGGTEYVDVNNFEDFDYVALGHLHRPQKVKEDKIRYAGSLMKYSFSEATQHKSMTLVDLKENGEVILEDISFTPIRDLRIIKGKLKDLIAKEVYTLENTEDYIMAILTDEALLYEPMSSLRAVYPNILKLEYERNQLNKATDDKEAEGKFELKSPYELFHEFYEQVSGDIVSEAADKALVKVVDHVQKEDQG